MSGAEAGCAICAAPDIAGWGLCKACLDAYDKAGVDGRTAAIIEWAAGRSRASSEARALAMAPVVAAAELHRVEHGKDYYDRNCSATEIGVLRAIDAYRARGK